MYKLLLKFPYISLVFKSNKLMKIAENVQVVIKVVVVAVMIIKWRSVNCLINDATVRI
jgi:hypothetical protein